MHADSGDVVGSRIARARGRDGVLVVDDEPLVRRAVERILAPCGLALRCVADLDALDEWLAEPRLAVVLLDLFIGRDSGLDGLARVKRARPDVEVVMMTGRASIESAVQCIRAGAFDYLCKPFSDLERVRATVRAAGAERCTDEPGGRLAAPAARDADGERTLDWRRLPLFERRDAKSEIPLSLEAYERLALERALCEAGGDPTEAARRLGIGRSTYYRRAAKLGLELRRRESERASATSAAVGRGTVIR